MKNLRGTATPTIGRRTAFHLMSWRACTTSRPLPTRSPATNKTLTVTRTRMPTLPWARTAAQTQQPLTAMITCRVALRPHRLLRAQRLGNPRSHRSSTQQYPRTMSFCLSTGSSAIWRPWLYLLTAPCMCVCLGCCCCCFWGCGALRLSAEV
ncbi:complement regulatory protein [Trypanosoma cruzi]|nr:complement regulatory protein [Trypanosoma cruzi]